MKKMAVGFIASYRERRMIAAFEETDKKISSSLEVNQQDLL